MSSIECKGCDMLIDDSCFPTERVLDVCQACRQRKAKALVKYGLTFDEYEDMYYKQEEGCAICGRGILGPTMFLCVDHNHDTGEVRGLLCSGCNVALGFFRDSPWMLRKAAEYLGEDDDDL